MIRRISLLIVLATIASATWAQLLWKVEGNGLSKPSYLFGTHHIAPASLLDSIKGFDEALNGCDAVYGEMHKDVMTSMESQQRLGMALIAPADSTLDKVFTPEEYAVVKQVFDGYYGAMGVHLDMLNQIKPIGVSMQLQVMQARKVFSNFSHDINEQIDAMVQARGKNAGKELGGFETLDDQIGIMLGASIADQAKGLHEACSLDKEFEEISLKLCEAYINQDLDYMYKQTVDPDAGSTPTEAELNRMLWNRNHNWVIKLKELMPQKSILVCVGAGHLPGEKGLVNLLRCEGYTVTPISK